MDSEDNRAAGKNDESQNPTSSSGPATTSKEDFFAALAAQNQDFFNQHFSSYKSVPNEKSNFEEWKKRIWKNQESDPEYGPKEVVTLPSQCLAINKPNGCLNYVHFGIRNNSNTSIKYSVTLKNLFLELVDNSEGVLEVGCTVRVRLFCKFDSHAPIDDELILKFEYSGRIFARNFPTFYDPEDWSFCILP